MTLTIDVWPRGKQADGVSGWGAKRTMAVAVLSASLFMTGCGASTETPTTADQTSSACHSYAGFGSEQARLEASEMVVVGTIEKAANADGKRTYELMIEDEIMGAPEHAGNVVEFSVPGDCDGSPSSLPEFQVGDRVKAYLRSEDPDTLHGAMTVLSPHEGLEAVAS